MSGQEELQWTEPNGELLCHPTSKDLEHKEELHFERKILKLNMVISSVALSQIGNLFLLGIVLTNAFFGGKDKKSLRVV